MIYMIHISGIQFFGTTRKTVSHLLQNDRNGINDLSENMISLKPIIFTKHIDFLWTFLVLLLLFLEVKTRKLEECIVVL